MSGQASITALGLIAGSDAHVRCSTYPDQGPILSVSAGPVSLDLSVLGRDEIPVWGVAFARELARQAQRFAAECERIHATQNGPDAGCSAPKDTAA
jgi:hypothetical protein